MQEKSKRLGKYELLCTLGEGGMGVVYKAFDPHLTREVAIKTIRASLLEGKSGHELRERFRREARAEGRLLHPNIITIYEFQEDAEGTPFFVMEYVEGKDLKQYLSKGIRFNLDKTLHIIQQVLSALAHSHREGIVHRDINPANIILLENDTVKIADFGIAKMDESEYTATGIIMGTPHYISPEQRLGHRVDGRADLYSTGAVMFELLTGEKASPGLTETRLWSWLQEGKESHLDISDPKTQRIFNLVVLKALNKDPDDRFESAEIFLQASTEARPTPAVKSRSGVKGLVVGAVLGLALLAAVVYFTQPVPDNPTATPLPIPETAPSELPPEDAAKLQQHMKVARIHLMVGRLMLPEGSNAFHSYQLALALDPYNAEAREGMQEVRNTLVQQVEKLIESGNVDQARQRVELGLKKFSGDRELIELQQTLD